MKCQLILQISSADLSGVFDIDMTNTDFIVENNQTGTQFQRLCIYYATKTRGSERVVTTVFSEKGCKGQ